MGDLKKFFLIIMGLFLFASCKPKKASLTGDEPVEISDFIDFFPEKKLPFTVADTSLLKKDKDSLLIGYKVFTQFVPDSLIVGIFGKTVKPKIYPLAAIRGDETYLISKMMSGDKRLAFVTVFDKKDQFIAGMPLLRVDQTSATQQSVTIDRGLSLTQNVLRKNADGSMSDGKDVYILNKDAKAFTLIMTDALDDKVTELINPIDTASRKQKFTADYGSGKMNLVSFRDGRKSDRLSFFIHFEKNNGECTGELKGEAILKTNTRAEYREPGEPCSLQFDFTNSAVTVKELGGCGSRRGLRCSFDGSYTRKKEAVKTKTTKGKKSSK